MSFLLTRSSCDLFMYCLISRFMLLFFSGVMKMYLTPLSSYSNSFSQSHLLVHPLASRLTFPPPETRSSVYLSSELLSKLNQPVPLSRKRREKTTKAGNIVLKASIYS